MNAWRMFATASMRLVAAGALTLGATRAALADTTNFDSGDDGWSVSGRNTVVSDNGNPGANMDVVLIDVFGADIRNTTNPAFLGDYTARGAIRLTVDVRTDFIDFFGTPVTRELVVELRDNTPSSTGAPYVSVWASLGILDETRPGWRTYAIDLLDPNSTTLPAGWGGTGDEDPVTFEPRLPADRTFTSVLASVDELHFTTFVPGFFFGFTNFGMAVDNVGFTAIPEPTSAALLLTGLLAAPRRFRRN